MIALLVIMRYEFADRPAERLLAKEDDSVQAFLLDGSHEPFRVSVQIRRFRRQHHRLHASGLEDRAKLLGEYRFPIKDQVTLVDQNTLRRVRQIAANLLHPLATRLWHDASKSPHDASTIR